GRRSGLSWSGAPATERSTPRAPRRTRSRSVRTPTGFPSSATTTTEPTRRSRILPVALASVSSGVAVTTGLLMSSATVLAMGALLLLSVRSVTDNDRWKRVGGKMARGPDGSLETNDVRRVHAAGHAAGVE